MKWMILAALFPCLLAAQGDPDQANKDCFEKATTTADQMECAGNTMEGWDKELNRAYKDLMSHIDATQKKTLVAAQREWIKFRDLEFKLIDALCGDGSVDRQMAYANKVDVVRKRAKELVSRKPYDP